MATLAVVTNGFEKVQMNRLALSGLDRYLDGVFVSEKVGATKPSKKIFDMALNTLGIEHRDRVLVVGDSLRTGCAGRAASWGCTPAGTTRTARSRGTPSPPIR